MFRRLGRRVSPSMAVALLALFVALGGVGWSATGGTFILGQANTATTPSSLSVATPADALVLTNNNTAAGSTALRINVPSGHPPLKVNSAARVQFLNADRFDDLDSTSFLRNGVAQSGSVAGSGAVLDVANTGTGNGAQGRTASGTASGVYGENTSSGFGVAGRAGSSGIAVYGDNTGSGYSGFFNGKAHVGGNLEVDGLVDCFSCIAGDDVSGQVSDAGRLDGIDSTGFVQGRGTSQAAAIQPGVNLFLGPALSGFLRLSYQCPSPTSGNGVFVIYNDSGSVANVFVDNGGTNPAYTSMPAGTQWNLPAAAGGDSFHIQAQGALGVQVVDAATVNRASDCHAQAQALLTG